MNCSLDPGYLAMDAGGLYSPTYASCVLYSVALQAHGGPKIECTKIFGMDPGANYSPVCEAIAAIAVVC